MAAAQQMMLGYGSAGGAGGGIAYVAGVISQGTPSGTTSAGIDTTGADFLAVWVVYYFPITVSDSYGNTWVPLTETVDATTGVVHGRWYYCLAPVVGAGHTFTAAGSTTFAALAALAFSGVQTAGAFDAENGAANASDTYLATGSVTPDTDGSLLLAGLGCGSADTPDGTAVDGGLTLALTSPNVAGNSFGIAAAYAVQAVAAAANPEFTWTTATLAVARIATFRPE